MAENASVTLPAIRGWPYQQIAAALCDFQAAFQTEYPPIIVVGSALWSLLRELSDADEFYALGIVPIRIDNFGILEPHEFMVTYK